MWQLVDGCWECVEGNAINDRLLHTAIKDAMPQPPKSFKSHVVDALRALHMQQLAEREKENHLLEVAIFSYIPSSRSINAALGESGCMH